MINSVSVLAQQAAKLEAKRSICFPGICETVYIRKLQSSVTLRGDNVDHKQQRETDWYITYCSY